MQDVAAQIGYWDRVASEKRFSHPLRLDWLEKYSSTQARILDYGCGYGRTLAALSRAGFMNLVGVDFSARMLARARVEVLGRGLIRNDGRGLPFRNDSFDVVLLFAVLTCIPDDDEQRQLVTEVHRVLRPGGILYVSDLLINDDARNRQRYEQYAESYGRYGVFELPEGVVVRHHRQEWIEELMSPFEMLEHELFTVTTMNGNASSAFQYLGCKSTNG
ncbi:MAG TPA: class I SAM-dependent methyltransferase [Pyrinomonadaceae bacterium]|jgi:SAM-dependent methyltransferase|nr:class I SAM-dependent methyltransferase [Pyrinomonadaceae bacterium]